MEVVMWGTITFQVLKFSVTQQTYELLHTFWLRCKQTPKRFTLKRAGRPNRFDRSGQQIGDSGRWYKYRVLPESFVAEAAIAKPNRQT